MKISVFEVLKNMGLRYVLFRAWYEFLRRTGIQKYSYKTESTLCEDDIVERFRSQQVIFIPMAVSSDTYSDQEKKELSEAREKIISGLYPYFSGKYLKSDHDDWLTNPQNGYKYDGNTHWTLIEDINPKAGDIKYVWEKARFCWAYDLMRADRVLGTDSFNFIMQRIHSFISHASANSGPHWRCGQELSLRVINWITVMQFYRERIIAEIDNAETAAILSSIYDQMKHVYRNRSFARIAVRNNHAISEALGLYITGSVCPYFKGSARWRNNGVASLEKEGLYQIYKDGAYIQHSFNYQRVVVQQYLFALALFQSQGVVCSEKLRARLKVMLNFMLTMQNSVSGMLPNYGANDGALFFPVGRGEYQDYRPQLNALHAALYGTACFSVSVLQDEVNWFFGKTPVVTLSPKKTCASFEEGGYYFMSKDEMEVYVRCASLRHRPAQADQLHMDLWYRGLNILHDCGSYTYNMDDELFGYFAGTRSHNTLLIESDDQMKRGARFIWYYWPRKIFSTVTDGANPEFKGEMIIYRQKGKNGVRHMRQIRFLEKSGAIEIIDTSDPAIKNCFQLWHYPDQADTIVRWSSFDENGQTVSGKSESAFYSKTYGVYENCNMLKIPLVNGYVKTIIECTK